MNQDRERDEDIAFEETLAEQSRRGIAEAVDDFYGRQRALQIAYDIKGR